MAGNYRDRGIGKGLRERPGAKKRIRAELGMPLPFKPERPEVAPEVSRSFTWRRNAIDLAEADKMSKIRRGAVFTRKERKMRRKLGRLEGCKGPGMHLLQQCRSQGMVDETRSLWRLTSTHRSFVSVGGRNHDRHLVMSPVA